MSRSTRIVLVALGAIVLALAAGAAALLLTQGDSRSALKSPLTVAPAVSTFPRPPAGSFVLARQDDADVLALAVLPTARGARLQVSDVTQEGAGARGLHVSFAVATRTGTSRASATACGAGCYRADVALATRPLAVAVHVVRPARSTDWKVALPASWPAADASAIVARADRVWRALHSLSYHERLASDSTHAVVSDWQIVAPDRLAYQIRDEGQAVIVGLHRWDRQKGGAWVRSSANRLQQPDPFWVEATDAHLLGSATIGGHAVWRVSFFDPRTPGWFVVAIDRRTSRTLDVRMTAAAHFMHDAYGAFNTSIKISPPSSG